ncbi:hypothetical protein Tco_0738107, partial [Tanacetum coccineum]
TVNSVSEIPTVSPKRQCSTIADYISGPRSRSTSLHWNFVSEPIYLVYIPQWRDEILRPKGAALPAAASPLKDSPGYIPSLIRRRSQRRTMRIHKEDPDDLPC